MENASRIERRIARRLIEEILVAGLNVTVSDGEEVVLSRSKDQNKILSALATTDFDILTVCRGQERLGYIYLIWGNEDDLIGDCSEDPEEGVLEKIIRRAA